MIRRRGFTLFEVVVALALSVLLLAGIYAGMDLYWRFSTTGQEEVERAQIARAVLRQIETDLRSVVYQSPEMIAAATASVAAPSGSAMGLAASGGSSPGAMGATGTSGGAGGAGGGSMGGAQSGMSGGGTSAGGGRAPTGGGGSASTAGGSGGVSAGGGSGGGTTGGTSGSLGGGSSAGGTGSASGGASAGGAGSASGIAGVGAAGAGNSGSGVVSGLFGTQDSLRLTAAAPSRKAVYVPLGSQVPGMARACDLLTVGYQLGDASQTMSAQPSGLARLEGDRLQQELARQNGDTQTQMAGLQMLAPEVTGLTFAYFDGYQWRSDWDSQALGGLPMAVEVLLEITTPPRVFRPGNPASSRQPTTQSFRLVVSLPLAKAIDTSTLE
ncbi:MAG: prepilin-type N-terminal cleavage/methylation domain-containing protein [Planctomycetaceae bacterium]